MKETRLYKEVVKFVNESFAKKTGAKSFEHFERTVHWIKELNPNAYESVLIAAYAHDIERAFRTNLKEDYKNKAYLKEHQESGAEIIGEFLKEKKADIKLISEVKYLVSKHEVGGTDEQNLLKDADSISFLENNAPRWVEKKLAELGKEQIILKLDWMFNRITSTDARLIAKPMYLKTIKMLEAQK